MNEFFVYKIKKLKSKIHKVKHQSFYKILKWFTFLSWHSIWFPSKLIIMMIKWIHNPYSKSIHPNPLVT